MSHSFSTQATLISPPQLGLILIDLIKHSVQIKIKLILFPGTTSTTTTTTSSSEGEMHC